MNIPENTTPSNRARSAKKYAALNDAREAWS